MAVETFVKEESTSSQVQLARGPKTEKVKLVVEFSKHQILSIIANVTARHGVIR